MLNAQLRLLSVYAHRYAEQRATLLYKLPAYTRSIGFDYFYNLQVR